MSDDFQTFLVAECSIPRTSTRVRRIDGQMDTPLYRDTISQLQRQPITMFHARAVYPSLCEKRQKPIGLLHE